MVFLHGYRYHWSVELWRVVSHVGIWQSKFLEYLYLEINIFDIFLQETQYSIDLKNVTFYNALLVEIPLIMKVVSAIPCSFIKNITSAAARRTAYAENLLNRYRQYLKSNPDCEKPMLLSRELKAHDAGQISHDVIESDAEAYILGGSDTTAITLTYLVWVVSEHPAVQQRLIREVRSLPDGFKADDLKKLSYMGQVIEESLRLYGAAPGDLPRAVPAGGKRLCGHYIPGGLTVTTQAYTMHRDPRIFPEPEKLLPCIFRARIAKLTRYS